MPSCWFFIFVSCVDSDTLLSSYLRHCGRSSGQPSPPISKVCSCHTQQVRLEVGKMQTTGTDKGRKTLSANFADSSFLNGTLNDMQFDQGYTKFMFKVCCPINSVNIIPDAYRQFYPAGPHHQCPLLPGDNPLCLTPLRLAVSCSWASMGRSIQPSTCAIPPSHDQGTMCSLGRCIMHQSFCKRAYIMYT